ncbi:MAG: O-antigen ligase family protein [Phycisphaerales bacterium]
MTPAAGDRAAEPPPGDARVLAGVLIILTVVALRCLSPFDPFPYWAGDPFESPAPTVGLTPATSVLLDCATALAAALACSGMLAAELRRAAWSLAAAAVALLVVLRHSGSPSGLDNFVYGSMQVSAFAGAAVVFATAGRARIGRLVLAVLLGLLGLLLARSLQQVWYEHPRTLETFQATREQFFRSQGWTPDSPMAKAFERRLGQAEASGYFGMANALATLGAAGFAAALGLGAGLRCTPDGCRKPSAGMLAGQYAPGACATIIVYYCGAKGGYAAWALGAAAAGVGLFFFRRAKQSPPRVARFLGPAVVLATLGAVVARGLIGTRIGELSILFRWFYMEAAARIFGDHPLLGVGPMGFKSAYLLAKEPLSPEEVTSPHSVLLDLLCAFGIAGAALALLWTLWVSLGAARLLRPAGAAEKQPALVDDDTPSWKPAALILTLATIGAIALERDGMTPDTAFTRLAGLGLGVWIATSVVRILRSQAGNAWNRAGVRVGLAAAALACAAHCQIELTSVTPGAGAWCLLLLALAGGWEGPGSTVHPAPTLKRALVVVAVLIAFVGAALPGTRGVLRWQAALGQAYQGTEPVAEFSARRNALATGGKLPGFESDSLDALARDISASTGSPVPARPEAIDRSLAAVRATESARALAAMPATPALPHFPTVRARTRLAMVQAEAGAALGSPDRARSALAAGRAELDVAGTALGSLATYWAWVGTFEEASEELERQLQGTNPDQDASKAHARASLDAWRRAHDLGPQELLPARKAMGAAERLGLEAEAGMWARECLRINDQLRLDPLEQLGEADIVKCKSLAGK